MQIVDGRKSYGGASEKYRAPMSSLVCACRFKLRIVWVGGKTMCRCCLTHVHLKTIATKEHKTHHGTLIYCPWSSLWTCLFGVRRRPLDVGRDRWKGQNPNLVVVDHLTYPQSRSQVIKLIGLPVTTVDREGTKRQREERKRERERGKKPTQRVKPIRKT